MMPPSRYAHAEAYCLMLYTADDGSESETVWNSRDGVTPMTITLRNGKRATHANWRNDARMAPDFTPPPGMRIFTDLTPARARWHAQNNLTRWAADPELSTRFREAYGHDDAAIIEQLTAEYLRGGPGAPDLIDPAPDLPPWTDP